MHEEYWQCHIDVAMVTGNDAYACSSPPGSVHYNASHLVGISYYVVLAEVVVETNESAALHESGKRPLYDDISLQFKVKEVLKASQDNVASTVAGLFALEIEKSNAS